MQRARSGLQNHRHRRRRRKAVVGTVVRGELAELGDRVSGWGDAHATGTSAVIIFASVEQVDIVVLAQTIKFHVSIPTNWGIDVIVDLARRSRRQRSKLVDTAPVYRDLAHL